MPSEVFAIVPLGRMLGMPIQSMQVSKTKMYI